MSLNREMSFEGKTYTPKNILITGGCGFIGSNVVAYFVKKYPQYYIVNLDKIDYCSSLKNIESLNVYRNYKFVRGNILSSDLISYLLEEEGIDTIIHFAAQTHVDNSFGNSFHFTETNVMGTHTLLESAHRYGKVKRFIHVSTDEVYGEIEEDHGVAEEKVLEPTNPYAATKAAAEFIVKSYNRSFGLPTIITRGNNVYGPHQYPEKLIPKFTLRLKRDLPCCLHGDGTNTRNFLYVEDVARAFDTIVHKGEIGQVYNIGTDFELSNLDLAKKLIRIFGKNEEKYIQHVENRKYNDQRYAIDSKKLKQLGWAPEVDFEEGLKKTVEWYLTNEENWDNVEQALTPHPQIRLT